MTYRGLPADYDAWKTRSDRDDNVVELYDKRWNNPDFDDPEPESEDDMADMSTDTTTLATDREWVEIEGKARANTVLYWPELVRLCNRLREAEKERDELRKLIERNPT